MKRSRDECGHFSLTQIADAEVSVAIEPPAIHRSIVFPAARRHVPRGDFRPIRRHVDGHRRRPIRERIIAELTVGISAPALQ